MSEILIIAIVVTIVIVLLPWIISILYGFILLVYLSFASIAKQEEYYISEFEYFKEMGADYPEKHLASLRESCESWLDYWSASLSINDFKYAKDYKDCCEVQAKMKLFWKEALQEVDNEIWRRNLRRQ